MSDGHERGATDCEVLIVGAGPVGLALAVDLRRRGVDVRIIDTLAVPTTESRAIVLHSRSLDHLEALGVLDAIMARALVAKGMQFHSGDTTVARISFEHIHAVHRHSAALLQTDTEAVLTARLTALDVAVERSLTLTTCTDEDDGVANVATDAQGGSHIIRSRYTVGADGARSTVRRQLGERLAGSFVGEKFMIGDVEGDHDYDPSQFHTFFEPGQNIGLLFPLPGNRVRVFAQLPDSADTTTPVTAESLQHALDERGIRLRITAHHWLTRFELKHGQVPRYRSGRIFLAGDAAHIHSPAGGLGMNTGIQDAINLGWKLARALAGGGGHEQLLDSYQSERHPVAAGVIAFTTDLTKVGTLTNPVARRVRNMLMHIGFETPVVADRVAGTIEQQGLRYRDSPIVHGKGRRVRPGDFAYVGGSHVAAALAQADAAADGHVAIVVPGGAGETAFPPGTVVLTLSGDDARAIAEAAGLQKGGIVFVRPDGYIGCITDDPAMDLPAYLDALTR